MRRSPLFLGSAVFALAVAGCSGGGQLPPAPIVTDIVSEGGTSDGDITFNGATYSVFTSNLPPNTVEVNLGAGTETRGFISFSLASIPTTASIQRATVFLPIVNAVPAGPNASVGLAADMVSFPPLDTLPTQAAIQGVYNSVSILVGPGFDVFPTDAGLEVSFDATNMVVEANRPPPLATLQIELTSSGGLVTIDELFVPATGAGAPVLRVEYF